MFVTVVPSFFYFSVYIFFQRFCRICSSKATFSNCYFAEEESVTLNLRRPGGGDGCDGLKGHEVTVSHTEATVRLLRPLPDVTYRPAALPDCCAVDISELRRMRKKRVAVVMEGEAKRSRDSMDTY